MTLSQKITFITGTDTGVGKTLLAASLVHYLRSGGENALAMKPFCTGDRNDVELLQAVQERAGVSTEDINPFFYPDPISPYAAQRKSGKKVTLPEVVDRIREMEHRCSHLVVEGAGGLLAPLGEGYSAVDVIRQLKCGIVLVARNRLGTINHTLLTIRVLEIYQLRRIDVVLMESIKADPSSLSNFGILKDMLPGIPVWKCPFLGAKPQSPRSMKLNRRKTKKLLAGILH